MRLALLVAAPLGVLFLTSRGPLAFVTLGLFGAALVASFTVSVVLGQAYLPRHAGMAAGLIVGLAIGTGGLGVALLGVVADHWGLPAVLWICALMPLAAFGVTLGLPAPRHGQ
jgi:FSR family fosmidomycin resistance protein-like MFS transporter